MQTFSIQSPMNQGQQKVWQFGKSLAQWIYISNEVKCPLLREFEFITFNFRKGLCLKHC